MSAVAGKSMKKKSTEAWVTLATNDSYCLGAVVLANSLKRAGTTKNIVVMVTKQSISTPILKLLQKTFDLVVDVEEFDSKDAANLKLLERPELGVTFTKLNCWKLVQFTKCVFLDADTLVIQNSDELFDREEFSAAPDAGWPDCFNSGVFVFVPSHKTYEAIMEHATKEGSFDGGDQGLLNTFFSDWATKDIHKHLPFLYNMVATATYTYLPAFKKYGESVKIVHFIGVSKPWHAGFDSETGTYVPNEPHDAHASKHLQFWWQIYHSDVVKDMKAVNKGESSDIATDIAKLDMGEAKRDDSGSHCLPGESEEQRKQREKMETEMNRAAWEHGHPDYRGAASMDNILKKIDSTLKSPESGPKK